MKKILLIVLSLIIIGVLGYVVFYVIGSDEAVSSTAVSSGTVGITDNQAISEWREESRTGVSSETGLMKSWPEGGPALIWSNKELPKGYSSPTFGNNSVYITGHEGENDILLALDPQGKIRWSSVYGRSWNPSNPESRCTPTVEGERVYVSSGYGEVVCINGVSGEIIWSYDASGNFRGTFGDWGIAESVLIDGDKVFFTPGGPETTMIALNKKTGDLIWKSVSLNDKPAYVSPILVEYASKRIIVNILQTYIVALNTSDGSLLWKVDHNKELDETEALKIWPDAPHTKCVTPLYHDGCIYITGGYDHGSMLVRMNEDATNATVVWTEDVLDVHHGGVVLADGYIYGANWLSNGDGNWCCIEWSTGRLMWEEHWINKGSIIAAEGLLYIFDERRGTVGLVRPNPEKLDLISSFNFKAGSGPYWAHPVIHNGVLYLRHGEALVAYNIKE